MDITKILDDITKNQTTTYETEFLQKYNQALIIKSQKDKQLVPHDYTRPSSLGKCPREIFFQRTQPIPEDIESDWSYNMVGILESGTDRHARIQATLQIMEEEGHIKNLDVEEAVKLAQEKGINTEFVGWNSDHTEARCKNADYGIWFQPDGLIQFQDKLCIFEIKTCSGYKMRKVKKQHKPFPEHLYQATAYALGLGVNYILFFYEDREYTSHQLFLIEVTEDMKNEVIRKLNQVDKAVEEGIAPPKEIDKCRYCKFKIQCAELDTSGEVALSDDEVF